MDLSGYCEFRYRLELVGKGTPEEQLKRLEDNNLETVTFICG